MSRIRLIAASDDYLLEEQLAAAVAEVRAELTDVEPEVQADDATPERVATELVSPSLFAAERLLLVPDARVWLGAPAPAGVKAGKSETPDVGPLIQVLTDGVPEGMGLVVGAWCGRKPTGELADAFASVGDAVWIPVPPPPKPWEDTVLSREQADVLEALVVRTADGVRFERPAIRLLLERLGFAPRLLVSEVRKLTGAAGGGVVDEALVRRLTFPRERSLEVVRDAVFDRELAPLLDLVAAASSGSPVNNWQGQRIDPGGFEPILHGTVTNLQHQMLYLRRVAAAAGLDRELDPGKIARRGWYAQHFKKSLAPQLLERVESDAPSPLKKPGGRTPTPFSLQGVFKGAARYSEAELERSIVEGASVETTLRESKSGLETMTAWLAAFVGPGPR